MFLPQRLQEQSTADLRLDVRVNQAHMQGLGLSQNLSSLKTLHCPTLSLPTPTIPVVSHMGNCRLQSIDSFKLAEFAREEVIWLKTDRKA